MLNGLVGTFEVRGEFDDQLDEYFETKGGGALKDRLMVVQQVQEKSPGLDGADNTKAMLVNGQWSITIKWLIRPKALQLNSGLLRRNIIPNAPTKR